MLRRKIKKPKIFLVALTVKYKYKTILGKIEEKEVRHHKLDAFLARTDQEAFDKFRDKYDIPKLKKNFELKYGGYDHDYKLNLCETTYVTVKDLMQNVTAEELKLYLKQ